jgi:antitoxin component YwqK of YwqJK toxin-antitoxin module
MHRVPNFTRLLVLFTILVALNFSCSPPSLEDEALEIIESNRSLSKYESDLERSSDGLQFSKDSGKSGQKETVGFNEDGTLAFKGFIKKGKSDGKWSTFFPDGRLRWQGGKENGINNGPFTMWYPNGKVKMRGNYKQGGKDGESIIFHMNGAKWREQWHENGKPVGIWKTWDETGNLVEELNHPAPLINPSESSK